MIESKLSLLGLVLLVGYLGGRLLTEVSVPPSTIVDVPDTRPSVSIIRLEGVRDGVLRGTMSGEVRFFLGDQLVLPTASGALHTVVGSFFDDRIVIAVPNGMRFVASRRGSKYYSVTSQAGADLVPENRMYFRTAADAEAAGYRK